jgi:hypothetical protein
VHIPNRIKGKLKKEHRLEVLRSQAFIGVNRVEVLVLLLTDVMQREFLIRDGQACYLRRAPLTTGWWEPVYVMSHLLMSTIWDVIPCQHLSHGSWPLGSLIPHLVPINIYLCSLVIFVRVLTTEVTES